MPSQPKSTSKSNSESTSTSINDELEALRHEVAHLRALVGPSEESYIKLRLDVLGARDAAIGAEAEAGRIKGRVASLEAEIARQQRDQIWFRERVVMQLKGVRHKAPTLGKIVTRLSR
jgi:hypothetical protein